jgi:TM2 domain-containing membrane protein YozV
MEGQKISHKNKLIAILLAVFLGAIGIHRFYAGKVGTGILIVLLTATVYLAPISVIWAIVDIILLIDNKFTDSNEKIIKKS